MNAEFKPSEVHFKNKMVKNKIANRKIEIVLNVFPGD